MIKIFKPLLFYIPSFLILIITLLIFSRGSMSGALAYFSDLFIYFNILFATLYFYLDRDVNFLTIFIVAFFSLSITLLLCEIIYPAILKENIILPEVEIENEVNITDKGQNVGLIEVPIGNLEKAQYYLNKKEYSSAWIYADLASDNSITREEALALKKEAQKGLKSFRVLEDNQKYIETLKYKNLINQKKYLDAYYFSLERINSVVYDQDFLIKLKSSYKILLEDFYSIDVVKSILNRPGYSDIRFYSTSGSLNLYSIEKLVEFNGEYYLQNININNDYYPYLYIDKTGKIFTSGFKEDIRFVYNFKNPIIPMDPINLKLYSKELFILSTSSLHFNMKIFSIKNIKYFKESRLSDLILSRLTGYSLIFIIYFMAFFHMKNRNYLNYLLSYILVLLIIKWFIKKIGLILIFSGLGLSFTVVSIFFSLWLFILIKKFNPSLALS